MTPEEEMLFAAALAAQGNAYAPYSGFKVGAAVRAGSGRIFAGANVENSAFPVGTCAEAGALAAMVAAGDRTIVAALVLGGGMRPLLPCGACRQRLAEFGGPDMPVYSAGATGLRGRWRLGDLLPEAFTLDAVVPGT